MRNLQPLENVSQNNDQVMQEIQSYLMALDSYPDRFAKEPEVSFEQHLFSLVTARFAPRRQN